MTLTCEWVRDQTGALVMKWTGDEGPGREPHAARGPALLVRGLPGAGEDRDHPQSARRTIPALAGDSRAVA